MRQEASGWRNARLKPLPALRAKQKWSKIEVPDSSFGFRLFDLGTALSQNLYEPSRDALGAALAQGYGAHRPLSGRDIAMVPVFTLLRCLASMGSAMGRLPADHPRARQYAERAIMAAGLANLT